MKRIEIYLITIAALTIGSMAGASAGYGYVLSNMADGGIKCEIQTAMPKMKPENLK